MLGFSYEQTDTNRRERRLHTAHTHTEVLVDGLRDRQTDT
jgi:hypothetical protein